MLQSFVITLREGIEAALIIGIILTYLQKTGQNWLSKQVYFGLAAAILFSILGAIAFQLISINEEAFEGVIMLAAAAFVASMLVWMMRTSKGLRRRIESQIDQITTKKKTGLGILLFTFLMVFREGIETVLFLSAVSFSTTALLSFLGGMLGLALAVTFGLLLVKGSVKVNLKKFFSITSAVLLVIVIQLIINGLHELFEAGWLPGGEREMAVVGPIIRNDSLFLVIVLLLPLIMLLTTKGPAAPQEPPISLTEAQNRKLLWQANRERTWRTLAGVASIVIAIIITASHLYSSIPKELSPAQAVSDSDADGIIKIPISSLQRGVLHRFVYEAKGIPVRFLLMRQGEGENDIKSAIDACLLCGDKGYYQDKDSVICRNCTAEIYVPTIGQGGGCNPIPLPSQVNANSNEVLIRTSELENNSYFFKK